MSKDVIIFKFEDNQIFIDVKFENETVWLNRLQLSLLFDRDIKTIGKHLGNIFKEGELLENAVVAKFATTATDNKTYGVEYYNLDVIISIGYRVKSIKGTQFRQWATARLKDYLVKGNAINQKRLDELSQMVSIIAQSTQNNELKLNEAKGLLNVLSNYTQSFVLLNQFDSNRLSINNLTQSITYEISYDEAKPEISALQKKLTALNEATPLFGNEKDDSFRGILGNILQSFDGQYCTQVSRNKLQIYSILSSRIIRSVTVINELEHFFSFGF
jgi:hypothetical protein